MTNDPPKCDHQTNAKCVEPGGCAPMREVQARMRGAQARLTKTYQSMAIGILEHNASERNFEVAAVFLDAVAVLKRAWVAEDEEAILAAEHTLLVSRTFQVRKRLRELEAARTNVKCDPDPLPMILHCPECRTRHIDIGEFATKSHTTHACQSCGLVWRPAVIATVGVEFLPGFKDTHERKI